MQVIDLKFTPDIIDEMFPCGDEGDNVRTTPMAVTRARAALGMLFNTADAEIEWHLPDVFSVRYGSSYVATARYGDKAVRFHSSDGDFLEGDDRV